jgi:hypothetical protein
MAKSYTLEDILQKPTKVEIPIAGTIVPAKEEGGMPDVAKLTYWVRPSTQMERDLAGSAARKASRTLRKILETEGTEERQLLVLDEIEGATADSLRGLWVNERLVNRAMRIRQESLEEREYVPEPEGDIVTPKEADDYENAVEEAEDRREMDVMEAVEQAQEELSKESENIPEKDLFELAIPAQIESVLSRAYESEFTMQLIFRCTFTDKACKRKAFKDLEQVYQLKDQPLIRLTNAHMSFLLDPDKVKNLAGGLR